MNVRNEPVNVMACVVKRETPPIWRWKLWESQHGKSISESGINQIGWRGFTTVAGSISGPLFHTHFSKRDYKNGHISRFYFVPDPISSEKIFNNEETPPRLEHL